MNVSTITPEELYQLQQKDSSIKILDVRTPAEFDSVHARTASNSPLDQLDPKSIWSERNDPDQPLYVICKMGGRSHKACEKFIAAGYENVVNIVGGTDRWVAAGLPTVEGERKIMALDRQVRIAAGSLALIGAVLAWLVHPYWLLLPTIVGAGLIYSGITDSCGMGMLLTKMPWNRPKPKPSVQCDSGG